MIVGTKIGCHLSNTLQIVMHWLIDFCVKIQAFSLELPVCRVQHKPDKVAILSGRMVSHCFSVYLRHECRTSATHCSFTHEVQSRGVSYHGYVRRLSRVKVERCHASPATSATCRGLDGSWNLIRFGYYNSWFFRGCLGKYEYVYLIEVFTS